MFETAFALSLTQFARSLSFPERLQHRTARNVALEPWRLRNTGLDALFYDVKSVSAEESFYISDALASEGLIVIVPPSGDAMLTICDSITEYKLRGGRDVRALAVAGIGGSAIGAVAFARNVADAIGAPVAAVVSGYGLGDIINETIGGSFFFGWLGHMRNDLEVIDDVVGRPHLGAYEDRHKLALKPRPSALDTDTVETLLADPDLSFDLLVGHSRGNRVLSEALYSIKTEEPDRLRQLARGLKIVTFGGRITMPPDCRDVIDVIGELDWFGEINSRPQIDSDIRVPLAGHSTNTDFAGALQVTRILKDVLGRDGPAAAAPVSAVEPSAEPPVQEPGPTSSSPLNPATSTMPDVPSPTVTPSEDEAAGMEAETGAQKRGEAVSLAPSEALPTADEEAATGPDAAPMTATVPSEASEPETIETQAQTMTPISEPAPAPVIAPAVEATTSVTPEPQAQGRPSAETRKPVRGKRPSRR